MINLHPGILLIFAGVITAFLPKKARKYLLVICPAFAFFLAARLPVGTSETFELFGKYIFYYLHVTGENRIFLFVFALMALIGGIYSAHNKSALEAFASMGYAGGAIGVTLAGDWVTLIFFWEFMAVTSLFLIWNSHTRRATSAGFRYLLIHMLGGNLLLFGIILKLSQGEYLITNIAHTNDLAFWLIFLGMAVNGAIVPLHAWVPDAYPEGTITGSVYLSSFTTKLAVLCLLRVFAGSEMLIYLGIVMIFYGACFALIENDIRRLLSYHIISQLGFMVTDVGMGTEMAMNAASSLAFGNVLYKSLLFMCAGAVIYATGIRKINQLGGLAKKIPLLTVIFFIGALSIAGVPLFAGFTCKSLSMAAAGGAGLHTAELLMMLGSIGTALSIPFKMGYFIFFGKDRSLNVKPIPKNMYAAMILGAVCCMTAGLCPNLVYRMLPYAMDYHPYHLGHILEYLQLLPAALLPFLMYLNKMEPHTALTLDLDWFARKPFKAGVYGLSALLCRMQEFFGGIGRKIYRAAQVFCANPMLALHRKPRNAVDRQKAASDYNADAYRMQIGEGMIGILCVIIVVAVYIAVEHFVL